MYFEIINYKSLKCNVTRSVSPAAKRKVLKISPFSLRIFTPLVFIASYRHKSSSKLDPLRSLLLFGSPNDLDSSDVSQMLLMQLTKHS